MSSPTDSSPPPNNDDEVVVQGIPLSQVVSSRGPFLTCYLQSGENLRGRLEAVLSSRADISKELATVARTLCPADLDEGAVCVVANEAGPGAMFRMADPITQDVFRVGSVPSLGSLVESASLLPSHSIITVAQGGYSVTSFGSSSVPSSEMSTVGQYDLAGEVVTGLGFQRPDKIMVIGLQDQSEELVADLAVAFPRSLVTYHPEISSDTPVEEIADMVVTSAASLRAELTTLELGRFRAARAEGITAEEFEVLEAIATGTVSSVLAHDDPDDERLVGVDRLVDLVTAGALRRKVPLTLIPEVPAERGPIGGIGAILKGNASQDGLANILPEAAAAVVPNPGIDARGTGLAEQPA